MPSETADNEFKKNQVRKSHKNSVSISQSNNNNNFTKNSSIGSQQTKRNQFFTAIEAKKESQDKEFTGSQTNLEESKVQPYDTSMNKESIPCSKTLLANPSEKIKVGQSTLQVDFPGSSNPLLNSQDDGEQQVLASMPSKTFELAP